MIQDYLSHTPSSAIDRVFLVAVPNKIEIWSMVKNFNNSACDIFDEKKFIIPKILMGQFVNNIKKLLEHAERFGPENESETTDLQSLSLSFGFKGLVEGMDQ